MTSRAGSLLLIFVAVLALTTGARQTLFQRWLPFNFDRSLAAAPEESDLESTIYARAEARLSKRNTRPGAPCAPAPRPAEEPEVHSTEHRCLPMPNIGELLAEHSPDRRRHISLGNRATRPARLEERARTYRDRLGTIAPGYRVEIDQSVTLYYQQQPGTVDLNARAAVDDLCGCTVAVISSNYASIVVHLGEQRDDDALWYQQPDGEVQRRYDDIFATNFRGHLENRLRALPRPSNPPPGLGPAPSQQNDWYGWFPPSQTRVSFVAPVYHMGEFEINPDLEETEHLIYVWRSMHGGFIYQHQQELLRNEISNHFGNNAQVEFYPYRPREGNVEEGEGADPAYGTDDRDIVFVEPVENPDLSIDVNMAYDDGQSRRITRLRGANLPSTGGAAPGAPAG